MPTPSQPPTGFPSIAEVSIGQRIPTLGEYLTSLKRPFVVVFDSLKRRQLCKEILAKMLRIPLEGCVHIRIDEAHPHYAWFVLIVNEIEKEHPQFSHTTWKSGISITHTAYVDALSVSRPKDMALNRSIGRVGHNGEASRIVLTSHD